MPAERPKIRQPIPPHAKKAFSGQLFDVYQWEQELFDGTTSIFEKLKRRDTVVVVPVLPERKLLINEDEQPGRDMVLTFPGGQIDEGETPEHAALRELHEETGYVSDELEFWKAYQPVTKLDWVIFVFIARDCRREGELHLDGGERISSRTISFDELLTLSRDPRFQNRDIGDELIEARYDAKKRAELERLLFRE